MTDTAEAPETTTETTETTTEATVGSNEQAVADAVATTKSSEEFSFVLDKYRAEGRSDQESAMEQAKAYGELQTKFGSFTGAPEDYEVKLSEGMSERVNMDDYAEDPLMDDFKSMAKEMNMSDEGFNKVIEMYFKANLATDEAMAEVRTEEMKALGSNAERRLENIQDWAKVNLDSENGEALINSLTSASAVQAIEALIAKTRNAPQAQEAAPAQSISHDKIKEMAQAKDEFGNDKMSDPQYAAQVRKMYRQAFGAEDHNVTVG